MENGLEIGSTPRNTYCILEYKSVKFNAFISIRAIPPTFCTGGLDYWLRQSDVSYTARVGLFLSIIRTLILWTPEPRISV